MKIFLLCLALVVVVEILWKLVRLLLSRFSVSSKPNEHQIFVTLSACYMMLSSKPFLESKFLEDDLGLDPLFFEEFFCMCLAALFKTYMFTLSSHFHDRSIDNLVIRTIDKRFPYMIDWLSKLETEIPYFQEKSDMIEAIARSISEHLMNMPLSPGRNEVYDPNKVDSIAKIIASRIKESGV